MYPKIYRLIKKPFVKIPLIFLSVSFVWTVFAEKVFITIFDDSSNIELLENIEEFIFICIVGSLLYLLIKLDYDTMIKKDTEIEKSNDKFKSLFEHHPTPTYIWQAKNDDFILRDYNRSARELTYGNVVDFVGIKASDLYLNDIEVFNDLKECFAAKKIIRRELEYEYMFVKNKKINLILKYVYVDPDLIMVHSEDVTARNRAESALIKSEKKYKALFEHSNDAIIIHDLDGKILAVNERFEDSIGFSRDFFIGKNILDLHQEHELGKTGRAVENLKFYGSTRFESVFKTEEGKELFVDISTRVVDHENGIAQGIVRDITDRILIETELREAKTLLEKTFSSLDQALFLVSPITRKIILANPAVKRIFGYFPDEIIGKTSEILHVDTKHYDEFGQWTGEVLNDGNTFNSEFRMRRKDGTVFPSEHTVTEVRNESGLLTAFVSLVADISERKKAEQDLQKSEELHRKLFETSPDSITICDIQGKIILSNLRALDLFGYDDLNEILGRNVMEFIAPEDRGKAASNFDRTLKDGSVSRLQYKGMTRTGKLIDIEISASLLRDKNGKPDSIIGITRDITETKLAEKELKQNEEKYRSLIENSNDVIWKVDTRGTILEISSSVKEIYGYEPEELIGKKFLEFVPEGQRNLDLEVSASGKSIGNYNSKFIAKDGRIVYQKTNSTPIKDEDGNITAITGASKDVTNEVEAQLKLQESERKFRKVLENIQLIGLMLDREGRISFCNDYFLKLTGWTRGDVIGNNWFDLFIPEDIKDEVITVFQDTIRKGEFPVSFVNEILTKDGSRLLISWSNTTNVDENLNKITGVTSIGEDITQLINTQNELEKHQEYLEELVDERTKELNNRNIFLNTFINTIPNPVFVKDISGRYIEVNRAFNEFFGLKDDEIIGKSINALADPEVIELTAKIEEDIKTNYGTRVYETEAVSSSKGRIPVLVYKASYGPEDEEPQGIVGLLIDISESKAAEKQMQVALEHEKELNEMKTNFISMASHEFRTPLTAILATADLLEMYGRKWSEEKYFKNIMNIQEAVNEMVDMLDDVLTLSRTDRGKVVFNPSPVNLVNLISELIERINRVTNYSHDIVLSYNCNHAMFELDSKLMNHIIDNLLTNAVKFSESGSKITVDVYCERESLTIAIRDCGTGIPEDEINHIFDPFFRAKNVSAIAGTGLGLAIVKKFVELHNGKIYVDSEFDKGSTFYVVLPLKY